uniref:Apyrase n=1 Tax=Caenorhabditis japonica TaxID=281687 RepID=A0A8R1DZ54_CAEJA
MIDMGGASVQIAFEMPKTEDFVSKDVFEINLGPDGSQNDFNYKIYSTTFLGYGANEGLKKYEASLVSRGESEDSCAPKGLSKTIGDVSVKARLFLKTLNFHRMKFQGSGQWDKCLTRLSSLIDDKTEPACSEQTCFLGYVPAPTFNLSTVQLYGFSEYWYTTSSFGAGGEYDFEKFTSEVRKFCGKDWVDIQVSRIRLFKMYFGFFF